MQRELSTTIACVLIAASVTSASQASAVSGISAPTGPFAVGRRVLRWQDDARREVLSSRPDDKRNVVVWLWYPSVDRPGAQRAPFVDEFDRVSKLLSGDERKLARAGVTHASADGPLPTLPGKFPVVLFSPGAGSLPALYTSLCEELASHGYVVAAVDHPYDDRVVLLADGRVIPMAKPPSGGEQFLRYQRTRVDVRTEDLRFVLDQLSRLESGQLRDPLAGRLELSRVGAFGHSVGGMTAAQACRTDPRVLACSNLDGVVAAMPAYAGPSGDALEKSFLFMEKPLPAVRGEAADVAERRLAVLRQKGNAVMEGVRGGRSYRVTISGATHATFSDEEVLTGKAERQAALNRLVRQLLVAFFDSNLKGAAETALDRPPTDPAIWIEVFKAR